MRHSRRSRSQVRAWRLPRWLRFSPIRECDDPLLPSAEDVFLKGEGNAVRTFETNCKYPLGPDCPVTGCAPAHCAVDLAFRPVVEIGERRSRWRPEYASCSCKFLGAPTRPRSP